MVLLAAAQRHLVLRLIFVLVLLRGPASPIELPKIDGQGPLNWVRHASILSGLPDGFGRSASQTLVSVSGRSLSLHKSIPGTIVDLWREKEALSWIVATEDTVREGYRALHVGFLCTDRGRVMSTATTAVANTNTADVACDDPVGIPDGVSIVEKCLADTNNPVPAGFEKRETIHVDQHEGKGDKFFRNYKLPKDGIKSDVLNEMIGKSGTADKQKRLKSGILVVRGLPLGNGMKLAVPADWDENVARKNAHPDLQTVAANVHLDQLIGATTAISEPTSSQRFLAVLQFASLGLTVLVEILAWWHLMASLYLNDNDDTNRKRDENTAQNLPLVSQPPSVDSEIDEGCQSCGFCRTIALYVLFFGKFPSDRTPKSKLRLWGTWAFAGIVLATTLVAILYSVETNDFMVSGQLHQLLVGVTVTHGIADPDLSLDRENRYAGTPFFLSVWTVIFPVAGTTKTVLRTFVATSTLVTIILLLAIVDVTFRKRNGSGMFDLLFRSCRSGSGETRHRLS